MLKLRGDQGVEASIKRKEGNTLLSLTPLKPKREVHLFKCISSSIFYMSFAQFSTQRFGRYVSSVKGKKDAAIRVWMGVCLSSAYCSLYPSPQHPPSFLTSLSMHSSVLSPLTCCFTLPRPPTCLFYTVICSKQLKISRLFTPFS